MKIEPLGDSALIVRAVDEWDAELSVDTVRAACRQLQLAAIPGVTGLVPAYSTIGIFFDPSRMDDVQNLKTAIDLALQGPSEAGHAGAADSAAIEVPVCYEDHFAPDLEEVAAHAGLTAAEVVLRHTGASYRVACVGFAPGFPYLAGLPAELATPRRPSPRKEIAAGAVAIGGTQTGIYPRKSPGGWNIIGRTPLRLFDVERDPAALFKAGDRVRFQAISAREFERLSR